MRLRAFIWSVILMTLPGGILRAGAPVDSAWLTTFERSGSIRTPRYAETIEYCRRLDSASRWVRYQSFGTSPQGRDLPLVIVSREQAFTPEAARRCGKAIVLIQSGIHAGEIDGKDASLMLIRDIAITRRESGLLDGAILLFVPIFNVDGHERFGPYNRINQNGPAEMGWRVTAQNLNLNRDYMKADAPEMRALLALFNAWLPDLYIDCHVTDGMDFRYDVTYAAETGANIDPSVGAWMKLRFLPKALTVLERAGHPAFTYVWPREEHDLTKGIEAPAAPPRFSTGYAALQNRPALLIETHVFKPYRTRVFATYHFLRGAVAAAGGDAERLRSAVNTADQATVRRGRPAADGTRRYLPLSFGLGDRFQMREFLGVKAHQESSAVTGGMRTVYTSDPETLQVPVYDQVTVLDSVEVPAAYLVPPEWISVFDALRAHGVRMERLARPVTVEVQSYRFAKIRWQQQPYEGRQQVHCTAESFTETRTFPSGTALVRTAQRSGNIVVHLLEPRGPDSFIAWGFFNAIFEQKEYAEEYVMEPLAADMLAREPVLRKEYEEKVGADPEFAASPGARLNWLYQRSRYADRQLNRYPVGRLMTDIPLPTLR